MNRPVSGDLDHVFIDMASGTGAPRVSLANELSPASVEQMSLKRVFDPGSPAADADGYVQYMDVDLAQVPLAVDHRRPGRPRGAGAIFLTYPGDGLRLDPWTLPCRPVAPQLHWCARITGGDSGLRPESRPMPCARRTRAWRSRSSA